MLNPLSQDLNVMRNNMLFGVDGYGFNQKRQQSNLRSLNAVKPTEKVEMVISKHR